MGLAISPRRSPRVCRSVTAQWVETARETGEARVEPAERYGTGDVQVGKDGFPVRGGLFRVRVPPSLPPLPKPQRAFCACSLDQARFEFRRGCRLQPRQKEVFATRPYRRRRWPARARLAVVRLGAQASLELREGHLDRIDVGRIRRQAQKPGAPDAPLSRRRHHAPPSLQMASARYVRGDLGQPRRSKIAAPSRSPMVA